MHRDPPAWLTDGDWRGLLVGGACAYEAAALVSAGRIPTLTHLAWRARVNRAGRLVLWLVLGWFVEHIFGEGR